MRQPHLLFITSVNLATNPRCLKEIKLALSLQYTVSVIKFEFLNWSRPLEREIEKALPAVRFYNISAGRKPLIPWLASTFLAWFSNTLFYILPSSFFINALAAGKRSWLIVNQLSKYPVKPDLVIAHNPAAFWPAFVLSNKLGIPYAIDIEDYHPGEFTEERKSSIMEALMGKALPGAAYISFASGSIKDLALRHFTGVKKSLVIDNCFEQSEFINSTAGVAIGGKLRLTWFSQNINFSRGLEKVVPVLQQFATEIEVTLIGNLKEEFKTFLRPYLSFVKIVNPLSQVALHSFLKDFDIGLAIEPGKDINNNIALSNKIWSYFQAGIFILATDTDAQAIFLKQHSDHGELFNIQREDTLTNAIKYVLKNKEQIRQAKHGRYMRAMAYSWEHESIKLANEWQEILSAS